jgi:hypothetical protein
MKYIVVGTSTEQCLFSQALEFSIFDLTSYIKSPNQALLPNIAPCRAPL